MRVTLLTAAKSTALLTRAAVKDRLGIADAVTKHDATLDTLIAAVSAAAVRVVLGAGAAGRASGILAQQYLAEQPGSGGDTLILPRRPIDPSTVSVELDGTAQVLDEDYAIGSAAQGLLYRRCGWPRKDPWIGSDGADVVATTFWAGYVPPTVAAAWTDRTVAVGDWVLPSNLAASPLRFRCKTAGAMGSTEPTWSGYAAGDEVTAGAATLVAHDLPDAPEDLLLGAHFAVAAWFHAAPLLAGIASDRMGPHEVTFQKSAEALANALPVPTLSLWEGLAC